MRSVGETFIEQLASTHRCAKECVFVLGDRDHIVFVILRASHCQKKRLPDDRMLLPSRDALWRSPLYELWLSSPLMVGQKRAQRVLYYAFVLSGREYTYIRLEPVTHWASTVRAFLFGSRRPVESAAVEQWMPDAHALHTQGGMYQGHLYIPWLATSQLLSNLVCVQ